MTGGPDLFLVAGPNGAGKSTYIARALAPTGLDLVDADRIAALRWPEDVAARAYDAAAEAAALRARYLAARRSFITETVFSHPSKVALVRSAVDAGYRVHLRVLVVPVELALARVAQRVAEGGHDVPEAKVRGRHARLWTHVAEAIDLAYDARVYDSSGQRGRPFLEVARYRLGTALWAARWPDWTPHELRRG